MFLFNPVGMLKRWMNVRWEYFYLVRGNKLKESKMSVNNRLLRLNKECNLTR